MKTDGPSGPGSLPYSELSLSEEEEIYAKARLARFSQLVLSLVVWFRTVNELIAGIDALEPRVNEFWDRLQMQLLIRVKIWNRSIAYTMCI
jgi:hypothetical protein